MRLRAPVSEDGHQPPPDVGTQIRQWVALVTAIVSAMILLGSALAGGRMLGRIEEKVDGNADRASLIGQRFVEHVDKADQGFRDVAKLVSDLDARLSREEGRAEGRAERRDRRRASDGG